MKDPLELVKRAEKEGLPVLVLIGSDKCALPTIRAYKVECIKADCDGDFLEELSEIEATFDIYASTHPTKIPD